MPALEKVDGHEDGEQVHVGRVELEVHIRRTQMVAGGHDSDHEQGETHRLEEGEGGAGASLLVWHQPTGFTDLQPKLEDPWPATFFGWFHTHSLQFSSQDDILLHKGDQEEEKAQEHVSHVAQDVVPHLRA